jgi:hypothetical protein
MLAQTCARVVVHGREIGKIDEHERGRGMLEPRERLIDARQRHDLQICDREQLFDLTPTFGVRVDQEDRLFCRHEPRQASTKARLELDSGPRYQSFELPSRDPRSSRWRPVPALAITRAVARIGPPSPARVEQPEIIEELGDDAIIAQQTAAHAPRPRVLVTEEARSVVISDPPRIAHSATFLKAAGEPTLFIRDRRKLHELSQRVALRRAQPARRSPVWTFTALGLVAFVLGGIVAFFATDSQVERVPSSSVKAKSAPLTSALAQSSTAASGSTGRALHFDELPLEAPPKK